MVLVWEERRLEDFSKQLNWLQQIITTLPSAMGLGRHSDLYRGKLRV